MHGRTFRRLGPKQAGSSAKNRDKQRFFAFVLLFLVSFQVWLHIIAAGSWHRRETINGAENQPVVTKTGGNITLWPRRPPATHAAPSRRRDRTTELSVGRSASREGAKEKTIVQPNGTHCFTSDQQTRLPSPNYATVKGERHSATNLIRQLLNLNGHFPSQCTTRFDCDHIKHGFFRPEVHVSSENTLVIVMVRNAFSWLLSMFYEPYSMIFWDGADQFGSFIHSNYSTPDCFADYLDCAPPVLEVADNLIQLRTNKYRNWIHFLSSPRLFNTSFHPNAANDTSISNHFTWSLIHQEDLIGDENQELTMRRLFNDNCIQSKHPFSAVTKTVTKSEQSSLTKAEDEALQKYTLEEIQFVLDSLDLEFERDVLGYDYSKITEEHIAKRVSGELNYTGPPVLKDELSQRRRELSRLNIERKLPGRDIAKVKKKKITGPPVLKDELSQRQRELSRLNIERKLPGRDIAKVKKKKITKIGRRNHHRRPSPHKIV